jgi:hypothetical protein
MKKYFTSPCNVTVEKYNECKYFTPQDGEKINYENVEAFEVVHGEAASQLEAETDGSCIDDFHEYLVLYFTNGETATFRNSYADLFKF